MTRTLFLHAGPPKTGSTSIQTFFRDNAAEFLHQGLYWPIAGTEHRSHFHQNLVDAFRPANPKANLLNQLSKELEDLGHPQAVFVTAETFAANLGSPAYLAGLKTFCQRLGYRLHVIVYIRPQVPLLNSLFTQHIKNWRPVASMEQFLQQECATGRHNYTSLFAQLFDDRDVDITLRPFNRPTLSRGLAYDICEVMGLETKSQTLIQPEVANTSPGPRTVAAFQRIRRRVTNEFPAFDKERLSALTRPFLQVASSIGWNDEKFGGFSLAQQTQVASHFASANAELASRVWSKSWEQIYSPEECAAPLFNAFDPAEAAPSQRREFRDFVEQSMETIAEFAAAQQSPIRRPGQ